MGKILTDFFFCGGGRGREGEISLTFFGFRGSGGVKITTLVLPIDPQCLLC